MSKLRITQVRSAINRPKRQKLTIEALGIKKMNKPREIEASPQVLGMIDKVKHLLKVEEIKA
jgi:large subunit ribosomal protein L30